MKVNLLTEVTNLDGTSIPDTDGKPMTLKSVFCNALISQKQGETITGVEKVRRYTLAVAIHNHDIVDLNLDDAKLVRDLVADGYVPLVVGQVWGILDPEPPDAVEADPEPEPDGPDPGPGRI